MSLRGSSGRRMTRIAGYWRRFSLSALSSAHESNVVLTLTFSFAAWIGAVYAEKYGYLSQPLAEEIIARGWDKYQYFSAYTGPIHAANENVSVKTTFDSWALDKALNEKRLHYPAMRVIRRPDDPLKDMAQRLIEQQGQPFLHAQFCGAHASMYVIDSFANVYACWERTGDPSIRIGHITPQGKYEAEANLNQMWRSRNVTTNKICRQCRYAMNCGGGCAVRTKGGGENIFSNFCDGYAARYRASVAEAYLAHKAGIKLADQIENVCDL